MGSVRVGRFRGLLSLEACPGEIPVDESGSKLVCGYCPEDGEAYEEIARRPFDRPQNRIGCDLGLVDRGDGPG